MNRVLLFSGGMDSEALRMLWEPEELVYVHAGTRYAAAEIERLPAAVHIVPMRGLAQFERPDGIVPARNLFFVLAAAQFGDVVGLGATAGDQVLDKSAEFAERAASMLSFLWSPQRWNEHQGTTYSVELPLKGLSKRAIVERVAELSPEAVGALAESFSCYTPTQQNEECGHCPPCGRKWAAFTAAGHESLVVDASAYVEHSVLPLVQAGIHHRGPEVAEVVEALARHRGIATDGYSRQELIDQITSKGSRSC